MVEYNRFRVHLFNILREISSMRLYIEDPKKMTILDLDGLKLEVEEGDSLSNGMLDQLIREHKITASMATSIMNDSTYTYDISTKLIDMGMVLFAARAMELKAAERDLALDDAELDAVARDLETEEQASVNQTETRGVA